MFTVTGKRVCLPWQERKCVYRDRKESVFTVTGEEVCVYRDRRGSVCTVTGEEVCAS